jgi:RimJ/RimL family protein N-acetyltransferase
VAEPLARAILAGNYEGARPANGWPHPGTSAAMALVLAKKSASVWLIQLAGRTIGDCGTHSAVDASGNVEIGYGLAEPFRGRGYGTEVVSALGEWLVSRPEVTRVSARTAIGNIASCRVLEKSGFVRVGRSATLCEYELVANPTH